MRRSSADESEGCALAVVSYERLRAMDVFDKNDEVVGIVTDLVVDTEANDVFYAVMTPAGVLEDRGLGMARFPVPLKAFQFLGDRLKLPREADFIRKAPPVAPDQQLNPGPEYATKIYAFWGVPR
jgi:sporulation protein YlmC with PRC-barrel domain